MAEILPATLPRRWLQDAPHPASRRLLPRRLRLVLLLASLLLTLAGGAAGLLGWWRPLASPGLLVLTSAPDTAVSVERSLAMTGDGVALARSFSQRSRIVIQDDGPTRLELQHALTSLRVARPHDRIILYVAAAAAVSSTGDLVLLSADADAENADAALAFSEFLAAIGTCRADGILVLLDLTPAEAATLEAVPVADLPQRIAKAIRQTPLAAARLVTSHSPGEQSGLLPFGNRTLFGALLERGACGAADGVTNSPRDGRVTADELVAYLEQELPLLAARTTGHAQHVQVFGQGPSFELSVATTAPALPDGKTKYPDWLLAAWQRYLASAPALDDATAAASLEALQRAEAVVLGAMPEAAQATAKAEVERYTAPAAASALTQAVLADALADYLRQCETLLATQPAAQAQPALQKLQAEFLKAQASHTATIQQAAVTVAAQPSHATLSHWQMLVALLDAWPKLPADENAALLRELLALRTAAPDDAALAEGARQSLALASDVSASGDLRTWKRTHKLWDAVLDERVHGETLLRARGYADPAEALAALTEAADTARQLRRASGTIHQALQTLRANERYLRQHVFLAEQNAALAQAWQQGTTALAELRRLLAEPAEPLASSAQLRAYVADLKRATAIGEASLTLLRQRVSSQEVASAVAACRQTDADVRDLERAAWLLRSPALAPTDRRYLWQAYVPLAQRLMAAGAAPAVRRSPEEVAPAMLAARRQQLHDAWQAFEQSPACAVSAPAGAVDLWLRDWQRFRAGELAKVSEPGARELWSSGGLTLLGPLACDALSPTHPDATFELLWQRLESSAANVLVTVSSPAATLAVSSENPSITTGEAARFRLRLNAPRADRLTPGPAGRASVRDESTFAMQTTIKGFMAVLASEGRRYHAPIALPQAASDEPVGILVSSSPTELHAVEQLTLLGSDTAVFVWLENNTPQPQQVVVHVSGLAPTAPLTLGPHEVQRIALPPPAGSAPLSQLEIVVLESPSQRLLSRRVLEFQAPQVRDVIALSSARLTSGTRGNVLTAVLQPVPGAVAPVNVSLLPGAAGGEPIPVAGGRLQGRLASDAPPLELTAILDRLRPGDPLRCELRVAGVREPLLLVAAAPPPGSSVALHVQSTPAFNISGAAVAQPALDYPLAWAAANAPAGAKVAITLHNAAQPQAPPVLARELPATTPPSASLSATNPSGGLLLRPITGPTSESFDTRGLVGRYRWQAELLSGDVSLATAAQPVIFDNSPPQACRFVRPPAAAAKATQAALAVTGWDSLTPITGVQLFVGALVDGKTPPTARLVEAARSEADANVWNASLLLPKEPGPCEVTALVTNAAGLTTPVTITIDVVESLPAGQGEIRGVVLEGSLAQANLEVTLEKTPGAPTAKTKTDGQGAFVFRGVAAGSYTVRSAKPASERKGTAAVKVEAGSTATATLKLSL